MSPPRPAADMTTDEIAAEIRQRMAANTAANPAHTAALTDVADRLVRSIRDRLPYIEPADAGAVMVNLGAYLTHALELFIGYGMDPTTAGQAVANVIAIAGQQLYGQTTKEPTR